MEDGLRELVLTMLCACVVAGGICFLKLCWVMFKEIGND